MRYLIVLVLLVFVGSASAQFSSPAGLRYFTETDDNDTSVVEAASPNTWVGINNGLTLMGYPIAGVTTITIVSGIYAGGGLTCGGDIGMNSDGSSPTVGLYAYEGGSPSGAYLKYDTVANVWSFSHGLLLRNGATSAGYLDFYEDSDNGTNRVRVIGPASTADISLTWPSSVGTVGQVLETDGSGVMSWGDDAGAGGALTYFTEADDNDTSVFTATGPNVWFGINDGLTLMGHPIAGVTNIGLTGNLEAGGTLNIGGNVAMNHDGSSTTARLYAYENGGPGGAYLQYDSVANLWSFNQDLIADRNLSVGNATSTAGVLTLLEDDDDGSNFASFMVPALAANTVYTLPADDGDAGEQLQSNGSGTLTWEPPGGGGSDFLDVLTVDPDGGDVDQTSLGKLEFFDAGLYLDADADGVMNITSDGTLELHSADWDISTTGAITNVSIIGGTGTTSDLSLKTTSGVGTTGADMHFLVGNDGATEAMTILNDGKVGIGTDAPTAPLEVEGIFQGTVGGFPSGLFHVTRGGDAEFANAVITGHNTYNTNTQLWYLGSTSSENYDIGLINRQNGKMYFATNNANRMVIDATGYVGIGGTLSPPERLSVVGNIATGDTTAGDIDVYHYFSTNGSWTTEYMMWNDGDAGFQLSDDLDVTGTIKSDDTLFYTFTLADPDALYAKDTQWGFDPKTRLAITIRSIYVSLDADPTTEMTFSIVFCDAGVGWVSPTTVDDTATVAGVTDVTGGFGDATVPAGKKLYFLFDADPDDAITQADIKIGYTID